MERGMSQTDIRDGWMAEKSLLGKEDQGCVAGRELTVSPAAYVSPYVAHGKKTAANPQLFSSLNDHL